MSYKLLIFSFILFFFCGSLKAQPSNLNTSVKQTMLDATKFMVEDASTNGGYVWEYLPDMSRRWGEMEAYKTMIWVQHPGTVSMGHLFLDAYNATGNEYYYQAAEKAADALIWGQSDKGGWNYVVDFAGDRSLKKWYDTIGKNGWRLEEFQHYYGNDTFDDDVTSDAARFILRMYLEKMDPRYKKSLDKAINFILKSQYPLGGWPQRYPLRHDFNKQGHSDYSSYYTYNDDVVWENIHFLIQCYETLGEKRFLDPIRRGMNFYVITQQGNPQGGWADQYNMQLEPAGARTYEPAALATRKTFTNAMLMMRFYQYTGDRKFLSRIPDAIDWLERSRLPKNMTAGGKYTHPTFVEVGTNKPLFVHRKGSNVNNGSYYVDYNDKNLLGHYGGKARIDVQRLRKTYEQINALSPEEATKDSPLIEGKFDEEGTPQNYYALSRYASRDVPDADEVKSIIRSLDSKNRWLAQYVMTSHPYIGEGDQMNASTDEYASTNVGDKTDTSPYRDSSDQEYISTGRYIHNMNLLINYINSKNAASKGK